MPTKARSAGGLDVGEDAFERISRRLVAVARRVGGGALEVRVVVGRAEAQVDELHLALGEQAEELEGLLKARLPWVIRVDAEAPAVGDVLFPTRGLAFLVLARAEGVGVHDGDARHDAEPWTRGPHLVDDPQEEARAVLEAPAIDACARVRAEGLVQEVAVTALHVDEGEARLLGEARRRDEALAQRVELAVRHRLGLLAVLRRERRVAVRDLRRELAVRSGEAA